MSGSTGLWEPDAAGVLRLPSGVLLRGRGLRNEFPEGPSPDFGLYLLGEEPPPTYTTSNPPPWAGAPTATTCRTAPTPQQ
ncbi:hypothetical protein [Streptomyces chumphonensis]|uniref:hypothetical protein n=1 Tax=Streptomyces chumphonensis TaxID=1214925 RepID=UPI003D712A69